MKAANGNHAEETRAMEPTMPKKPPKPFPSHIFASASSIFGVCGMLLMALIIRSVGMNAAVAAMQNATLNANCA